jgi:phenylpropionate dioxygenase-like ring-hydroxylating dioxygenase large terminal subunit
MQAPENSPKRPCLAQEMQLPSGWYAIAEERDLKGRRPNPLRRFGLDLVLWQGGSGWVAQLDRCPHRSAKLSLGKVSNGVIACPFHGFAFDGQGQCRHVPELRGPSPALSVRSWKLEARHGLLWLPWRNPQGEIPWFSDLPADFARMHGRWQAPFYRCVENQLDFAHLPFVHANTIGRGFDPSRKVQWEIGESGIRVFTNPERLPEAYFEFRFPNIWRLHISKRAQEFLAFVPVDDSSTELYLRHYQGFVKLPLLGRLVAEIAMPFNRIILGQDRRVVLSQGNGNLESSETEQLMPSDKAIVAFRRWLKT